MQLLEQLGQALERQAEETTLYDDRRDRAASQTIAETVAHLGDARSALPDVLTALDAAHETSSHLGHQD